MVRSALHRFVFIATLMTLALRAITPDGYMPGSEGSGLLFELCPDGLPSGFMAAMNGEAGHHHHRHKSDDGAPVSATEQCPIGHMLLSAIAFDVDTFVDPVPGALDVDSTILFAARSRPALSYRSRAPPA